MIFRQLFEPVSSTYTYLLACETTGQAMLIDPVVQRHRPRFAGVAVAAAYAGADARHPHPRRSHHRGAASEAACRQPDRRSRDRSAACVDVGIEEGTPLQLGGITVDPLHTPGHTDGHFAYRCDDRLFSGDALLIDGCGRTDFQNGDATALYKSVTEKLFTLSDDVLVYPAHDYQHRRVSSIGQEKSRNPRLVKANAGRFKTIMSGSTCRIPSSSTMRCRATAAAACVRTICLCKCANTASA